MEKQYNLYNFEALFKEYLLAGKTKPVSIKNYLSDFRHFAGWLTFYVQNYKKNENTHFERLGKSTEGGGTHWSEKCGIEFFKLISPSVITDYKSYLSENNIPFKTINRRLSTIRKFCSFCISQGWMKENAGKQVQNSKIKDQKHNIEELITQFKQDLIKQKINNSTINSYLNDVQEFLSV